MGKFYLANKHLWEKHRRERAYQQTLETGGSLGGGMLVEEIIEVRFEHRGEGQPPAYLRLVDFGQPHVAVTAGNAYIGYLDEDSTRLMRDYFRAHPQLENAVPAKLARLEKWSGLWIAQLGVGHGG